MEGFEIAQPLGVCLKFKFRFTYKLSHARFFPLVPPEPPTHVMLLATWLALALLLGSSVSAFRVEITTLPPRPPRPRATDPASSSSSTVRVPRAGQMKPITSF